MPKGIYPTNSALRKQEWASGKRKSYPRTAEMREHSRITAIQRGFGLWMIGKPCPWTSERMKQLTGPLAPHWKGGKTAQWKLLRTGSRWKEWRSQVFQRDNFTCQFCGLHDGSELHPHHIKPFSQFPKERFDVANGVTLCAECHRATPSWGSRKLKFQYQPA